MDLSKIFPYEQKIRGRKGNTIYNQLVRALTGTPIPITESECRSIIKIMKPYDIVQCTTRGYVGFYTISYRPRKVNGKTKYEDCVLWEVNIDNLDFQI